MKNSQIIFSEKAPKPIGPYSQAVMHNNILFVSGQISINPATGVLDTSNIENETNQVMENIKAIITTSKMEMKDIVKATIFLRDLKDFQKMNEVYGSYFKENPPAREIAQVSALPKNANVEISVIAIK
ncbi:MAG: Rid family detoxifying hydrolase [Bacteroidota bacterium]